MTNDHYTGLHRYKTLPSSQTPLLDSAGRVTMEVKLKVREEKEVHDRRGLGAGWVVSVDIGVTENHTGAGLESLGIIPS